MAMTLIPLEDIAAPARPALQRRSPWWFWYSLSLVAATLLAPGFLAGLLEIIQGHPNKHSLMPWLRISGAIVPFANAAAMAWIDRRHRRRPFTRRLPLMLWYLGMALAVGSVLLLLAALGIFLPPAWDYPQTRASWWRDILIIIVYLIPSFTSLALFLGFAHFLHAAPLFAWLAFRKAAGPPPATP